MWVIRCKTCDETFETPTSISERWRIPTLREGCCPKCLKVIAMLEDKIPGVFEFILTMAQTIADNRLDKHYNENH